MILILAFIIIAISIFQSGLYVKEPESLTHHVKNIVNRYLMVVCVLISFLLLVIGILYRNIGLICFATIIVASSSFCLVKTTTNRYFFANINLVCALIIIIESIIQFRF